MKLRIVYSTFAPRETVHKFVHANGGSHIKYYRPGIVGQCFEFWISREEEEFSRGELLQLCRAFVTLESLT